jgi:homocysteine S-methyltransferase
MSRILDLLRPEAWPLLLDGATGTELERRGFALEKPGWSARAIEDAPELLEAIHRDYADAGAEVITANTFRLHRRNLANWGAEEEQRRLVQRAVELARHGAGDRALIAASLAPIGDCYSPDEVPDTDRLTDEHRELAVEFAQAGVDLILVETMVSGLEAEAAARAAASTGIPFLVSFVTGPGGRLLSGQRVADVLPSVLAHRPVAVGVNCATCRHVSDALPALLEQDQAAVCVYANTGERAEDGSWRVTTASEPAVYAGLAAQWLDRGTRLIGGCCGTMPAHIRALQELISQRFPTR